MHTTRTCTTWSSFGPFSCDRGVDGAPYLRLRRPLRGGGNDRDRQAPPAAPAVAAAVQRPTRISTPSTTTTTLIVDGNGGGSGSQEDDDGSAATTAGVDVSGLGAGPNLVYTVLGVAPARPRRARGRHTRFSHCDALVRYGDGEEQRHSLQDFMGTIVGGAFVECESSATNNIVDPPALGCIQDVMYIPEPRTHVWDVL